MKKSLIFIDNLLIKNQWFHARSLALRQFLRQIYNAITQYIIVYLGLLHIDYDCRPTVCRQETILLISIIVQLLQS